MTTKLLLALNKWAWPILVFYALALTIGSLARVSHIPNLGFSFDDKIYHLVAYFIFTLLAYNYCNKIKLNQPIVIAALNIIIYGIVIEVLQYVITSYRTFDIYDALANTLGVVFAALIIRFRKKLKLK